MKKLKKTKIFIFGKKSHNAEKKLKGGTLWDFSTSIRSQNIKKIPLPTKRGTLWGKIFFRKKSLAVPKKNERGESLVSPGMVCYAEKQEKPFWFSSLDKIVHFDAIIFCRTFVELFWSVRVDRKQAGTGPSRRHIQGSKIAKRLPSVKYSFTEVENRKFFEFFFEKITY